MEILVLNSICHHLLAFRAKNKLLFLHMAQHSGSHLCRKTSAIGQDIHTQVQVATWSESSSDSSKAQLCQAIKALQIDSKPESKTLGRACSWAHVIVQHPEQHGNSQPISSRGH